MIQPTNTSFSCFPLLNWYNFFPTGLVVPEVVYTVPYTSPVVLEVSRLFISWLTEDLVSLCIILLLCLLFLESLGDEPVTSLPFSDVSADQISFQLT